ncbi:NACHT, LRR and PYD domains-containing protein 2 [Elephas maximus indicus]|uniref:NACHT, LRR and PYD domains-containing protein 2 n=1 Tax=Elephas maximus indicus TaxID=99487 RepID=UPI0021166A4B|nr:NACHT, LRR and PYD domains-containing protein 2 [Elephas maximus indicus]
MASPAQLDFNLQPLLEELDQDELGQFKSMLRSFPLHKAFHQQELPHMEIEQANGKQLAEILIKNCHSYWIEMAAIHGFDKMNRVDLSERAKDELREAALKSLRERKPPSLEMTWTQEPESSNLDEIEEQLEGEPELTQVERDDPINLESDEGWKAKRPDKEDKFRITLKKKFWEIWKNNLNPGAAENFRVITQRYKMLIPFCNPNMLTGPFPDTVVLRGPAGVGKTTLAKELMRDWTQDNLAKTFKYIFYLSCKELNHIGPCTCAELITKDYPELQHAIPDVLAQSRKILIIIDGFDELRFPPGALISDICGDWKKQKPVPVLLSSLFMKKMFPNATLLITTRPWALRELRFLVERPLFVDIEGFLEVDRKEYFLKHFQDEDQALRAFDLMRSNTALFSLGSAPMVCWVVCTCLKLQMDKGEDPTPTCQTTTSLFLRFICSQFMPAPDSCPGQCLQAPVKALCLLAAEGVWTQTSVFDGEDLKTLGVEECELSPFLDKNILQKVKGCEGCYSFIHLSVQQFFAAIFYVLGSEEEKEDRESHSGDIGNIQKLFSKEERLKNPSLPQVGYFLFGLSNEKRTRELETTFGCQLSIDVKQELLRWKVKSNENKPFSVMGMKEVFYCLYESQEEEFVKDAMAHFKEISLKLKSEMDVVHASFCLKHCQNLEKISLKIEKGIFLENDTSLESGSQVERSQKDQRILPFWMDLCSMFGSNKNPIFLEIDRSFLSDSSVRILCEQMASATHNLQKVVLNDILPASAYRDFCLAFSGQETLTHLTLQGSCQNDVLPLLCEVLRHPKCDLQYLRLESCSATTQQWGDLFLVLEINQSLTYLNFTADELLDEGVKLLCTTLRHPRCSLQRLSLENCHLTEASCKDLSSALIINQKLTHLCLAKNELGDGGVQLLCEGLSYPDCKLQALVLWNCGITDSGCSHLSKLLQQKSSLTHLDLGLNHIGITGLNILCEALKEPTCNLKHLRLNINESDTQMQKLLEEVKGSNPQLTIENDKPRFQEKQTFFF